MTLAPRQSIEIAGRAIGDGHPCFIVAEIAQAHDGSLGACHAYIDAVARAGASAIKFQTHIADAESTPGEPWRVKFSRQDATRYDYWKRMELPAEQWAGLKAHCDEKGLVFLSSAFSFEAVELLEKIGMPAWKVGSGETSNLPLIARMAETKAPVLLSSGMSTWAELDAAVETATSRGAAVAAFQCTTSYPCPPEKLGLNLLDEMRARYPFPIGFSDHSARTATGVAAVARGANLLEVHAVFSRECFGPDTSSSLTIDELAQVVADVRFLERALAHPLEKDAVARDLDELHRIFTKSVVAKDAVAAGTTLTRGHLALKKPGTGIPAARLDDVVGRTLRVAKAKDEMIMESDLA